MPIPEDEFETYKKNLANFLEAVEATVYTNGIKLIKVGTIKIVSVPEGSKAHNPFQKYDDDVSPTDDYALATGEVHVGVSSIDDIPLNISVNMELEEGEFTIRSVKVSAALEDGEEMTIIGRDVDPGYDLRFFPSLTAKKRKSSSISMKRSSGLLLRTTDLI